MSEQEPRRAAIYARISKDRDGEGLGVARQLEDCRALAEREGWEVVAEFSDNDVSAFSGRRREGYEALSGALRNGAVDVVVAWAVDRLYRRPVDLEGLVALLDGTDTTVATVTSGIVDLGTPEGRAMARVGAAIAASESERKSVRTKRERSQAARRGVWSGPAPFGYAKGDHGLVIVAEEAALIRQAARGVVEGSSTWRSIAQAWNARGMKTRRGNEWTTNGVRATLTSPCLAGLSVHNGEVVGEGKWEAILDRATHEALRSIHQRRKGRAGRPPALLTGIATCGRCGGPLYGANRGNGVKAYACLKNPGEHRGCGRLSIGREGLEQIVLGKVLPHLATMERPTNGEERAPEIQALEAKLAALEVRRDEVASLFGEGAMSASDYQAAREANNQAIDQVMKKLAEIGEVTQVGGSRETFVKRTFETWSLATSGDISEELAEKMADDMLDAIGAWGAGLDKEPRLLQTVATWQETPHDERRNIIRDSVQSVTVQPYPKDGKRVVDGSRVEVVLA